MRNKKAFVDTEILGSLAFIILSVMAISATILGWSIAGKMGFEERLPIWQLIVIIAAEIMASYVIAARG